SVTWRRAGRAATLVVVVLTFLGGESAGADGAEDAPLRIAGGGGIVNGYEYLSPTPLAAIGITVHHGFGATGIGYGRLLHVVGSRNWIGANTTWAHYRKELLLDDGGSALLSTVTEATVVYVNAQYEREVARSTLLGWRVFLGAGAGLAAN